MGMLFKSKAVLYLAERMNAEFAENAVAPAKGLAYWQGTSEDATEFREALDGSWQNKVPALGSITLEYFDLLIPDSPDGENPDIDPSSGKSYKRWIVFWRDLRKKDKATYKMLVKSVLQVLNGKATAIKSITFSATEKNTIDVDVEDTGSNRAINLITPAWHGVKGAKVLKKKRTVRKVVKKAAVKKKR